MWPLTNSKAGDPLASKLLTCSRLVAKSITSGPLMSLNAKVIVLVPVIASVSLSGIDTLRRYARLLMTAARRVARSSGMPIAGLVVWAMASTGTKHHGMTRARRIELFQTNLFTSYCAVCLAYSASKNANRGVSSSGAASTFSPRIIIRSLVFSL